jgi:CheY-like chemotaxis protein
MLRRLIGEHIQLVVRLAPQDVAVLVDPGQMQQILMNLAVNARDAMPRGGTLTIETAVVEVDDWFLSRQPDLRPGRHGVLRVSDTGCGIPGGLVPRIFEPFFTTKAKGEGTGLGLATVQGIAKESGGHVRVESEPGRGTTFSVYLPPTEERAPVVAAPGCAVAPSLRGGETVLYVEDDPALRALGADILRDAGYLVLVAADGSQALEVGLQSPRPIDVLVSDVVLPTLNGPEVWERLQGRYPGLPAVYVSGYAGDARLSSIAGENVRLLEKPLTSAALLAEVRGALEEDNTPPAGAKPPPPAGRSGELVRAIVWTGAALAAALSAQAAPSHVEVTRSWQLAGTWSQAQGLRQDRVYAITQTRDGYLWLGTRGGSSGSTAFASRPSMIARRSRSATTRSGRWPKTRRVSGSAPTAAASVGSKATTCPRSRRAMVWWTISCAFWPTTPRRERSGSALITD